MPKSGDYGELFDVEALRSPPEPPSSPPPLSKLEAVMRMGRLSGHPEELGPGSKERKSALVNLARHLGLVVDEQASKPVLGGQMAALLGTHWGPDCWSTGSTLTLRGLSSLLLAAERRLPEMASPHLGPEEEAQAVLRVLAPGLAGSWDGRVCIEEMRSADYSQWAQDEWAGFYLEYWGLPALIAALGGGSVTYVNTRFDYALTSVWDLKLHASSKSDAPLNDRRAVDACLAERGLGFIVATGTAVLDDDGSFRAWQAQQRDLYGKPARRRDIQPRAVRRSKRSFAATDIEAFHVADTDALAAALSAGALKAFLQGRQASGAARPPKLLLNLPKARRRLLVASQAVPTTR